jgi:hypothetical protein
MDSFGSFVVFPFATFLLLGAGACGGAVADVPSHDAPQSTGSTGIGDGEASAGKDSAGTAGTGGTVVTTGPQTVIGRVIALSEDSNDQLSQRFDMDFQVQPTPGSTCDQAAVSAGSCCYFAPVSRPPTQPPGDGGRAPAAETSAGTVTLSDVTTGQAIGSFAYQNGAYAHPTGLYQAQVWQPGDALRVTATGAEVGPFTVTAPGLVPPVVHASAPFSAGGQDVTISWQPDVNATTLVFSLLDGGTGASVACSASNAAGALTVDGGLLAKAFPTSTRLHALAASSTVRYAQTASGRLAFETIGWHAFDASTN